MLKLAIDTSWARFKPSMAVPPGHPLVFWWTCQWGPLKNLFKSTGVSNRMPELMGSVVNAPSKAVAKSPKVEYNKDTAEEIQFSIILT